MPRRSRVAASLLIGGALACPSPAHADEPATRGELELGLAALAEGRLADALARCSSAHASRPSFDAARCAGLASLGLGDARSAAERLADALGRATPATDRDLRAEAQSALTEAKRSVATVVLRSERAGVTLLVDAQPVGASPLSRPVYLTPGEHAFSATSSDATFETVRRVLSAGTNVAITVRARMAKATPAPTVEAEGKAVWPAVALGGLGLAGLATGFGLLGASLAEESDAEDLAATIDSCRLDRLSPPCAALADVVSNRNDLRGGATVGFVVGGLATATLLGYLVVPTPTAEGTELTAGLSPVPGGAMLVARGALW